MASKPPADPNKRPAAEAWFRKRVALTEKEYAALGEEARRRGWTIGGTMQLRVVQGVLNAIRKAAKAGEEGERPDFDAFKKDLRKRLKDGEYIDANSGRLKTSLQTTVQTAYSAGRWSYVTSEASLARRPYLMLDAVLDGKTTLLCRTLHGTVRRADSAYWKRRWPPFHFNCRTGVRALTVRAARIRGVTVGDVGPEPEEGFGLAPDSQDDWEPDAADFDDAAFAEFQRKVKRMRTRAVGATKRVSRGK